MVWGFSFMTKSYEPWKSVRQETKRLLIDHRKRKSRNEMHAQRERRASCVPCSTKRMCWLSLQPRTGCDKWCHWVRLWVSANASSPVSSASSVTFGFSSACLPSIVRPDQLEDIYFHIFYFHIFTYFHLFCALQTYRCCICYSLGWQVPWVLHFLAGRWWHRYCAWPRCRGALNSWA